MSDRQISLLATGSTDTVRNIRRGACPRLDTLEALCEVLGADILIRRRNPSPLIDTQLRFKYETISVDGLDVLETDGLIIQCSLLREVLAQVCQEWAETDLRGKERMYRRFCAYFPELESGKVVTQVMWEKSDGIPALEKLERLKEKLGRR